METPTYSCVSYVSNGMLLWFLKAAPTWCRAVSPSALAALISAARYSRLFTSFLSPDETDAKKAQSIGNETALMFLRTDDARLVSDSSHRFNCSARLNSADDMLTKYHTVWSEWMNDNDNSPTVSVGNGELMESGL